MGKGHNQHTRDKNKSGLAQVPKQLKKETDGTYEEFSRELADQADVEAQARASAANQRQQKNKR